MIFSHSLDIPEIFSEKLSHAYLVDEGECVQALIADLAQVEMALRAAEQDAAKLVQSVRNRKSERSSMQTLMHEFSLNTDEGIVLMCMAEALLRIPDAHTANLLIEGKVSAAHWERHLGRGKSLFINASTWSLMFSGRLLKSAGSDSRSFIDTFESLVSRMGEPVIRTVLRKMMKLLGQQFVLGTDIKLALKQSHAKGFSAYRYSFDMLGEAALIEKDAQRYFEAYASAIREIGSDNEEQDIFAAPSISVKLSALHPRYDLGNYSRVVEELGARVLELAKLAEEQGIALTIDAEEAERLELSLAIFYKVYSAPELRHWHGLGLAVQAYQKRAPFVIDLLAHWYQKHGRRIPVRLVKGAYWDTEIKRAQERGLDSYPVFTRKVSTDVSYLVCARRLFEAGDAFYPQFATHNAFTVAAIMNLANGRDYEFQRLHGMGEQLYDEVLCHVGGFCRTYAPVGKYEDLLPYLVRRLLENGANTSFVNRIEDESIPVSEIVANPLDKLKAIDSLMNPRIPLPSMLFAAERSNSSGMNLHSQRVLSELRSGFESLQKAKPFDVGPLLASRASGDAETLDSVDPCHMNSVGRIRLASPVQMKQALDDAQRGFEDWSGLTVHARAACLDRMADLLEQHREELMFLCVREAGRTIPDALSEVREAIDFCRYYAHLGIEDFADALQLSGPTGESNRLSLVGRGVFVCISPWNFPVAIFVGQIAAAIVAGNSVIAKPASQTMGIAHRCIELFHQAGVDKRVIQLVPVSGKGLSQGILKDPRIAGVAFTGSTQTAQHINRTLIDRGGAIPVFVGETGGLNVMVADSSALPEQLVVDCVYSAFNSAGQRCSALRVLCVQEEIADRVIDLVIGAMNELTIGDPAFIQTDVGPLIDAQALEIVEQHIASMRETGKLRHQVDVPAELSGYFVGPALVELGDVTELTQEIFGPVLHVVRFKGNRLPELVEKINSTGYGLTFGVHSRIDQTIAYLCEHIRAGNIYVNRNMIGAVVGVQPFGGMGLSGTGPKAGGPHYLLRFATERTVSINTAAVGGNAQLLAGDE